ncbi:hypothetical protein A7978_06025 (plasmid) [Borrelia turicatae]|uniref:Uncharacterized protein n=3 Tax=Borrelia TaxID=138 RepID=A0A172XD55_BORTU|nr:hypothetical protein [Borrelia turicatae]ANF34482.1 hypothetical protein A7978_06025 [Borrelia turicatae]UPA12732.1 hypothetical protein bvRMA01_001056 [Borrelia venezuelensis]UPA14090.1 hypothetical protein bt91E135_001254 [Borrelia turicatae 91E135]UPA15565.1 hypothetical protein btBTE5EL_001251 [Borrelia turicatae]
MKIEMSWIKHNEDALAHLINQALLARSVGSLPREGGLYNQNYWFVLVLSELNLYIKKLESESIGK